MPGIASDRPPQHLHALALHIHAAAAAVRKRHDAVDIGEIRKRAALERVGDAVRDGGRAVHGRKDADIVARRHAPIRADYAHEARRRIDKLRGLRFCAERIVARELAHRQVMQMHVLARRDRALGKADDLVIALDGRAGRNRMRRDLVAGRHEARDLDALVEERRARDKLLASDHHVIVLMEANGQRGLGQHGTLLPKEVTAF